MDLHSHLDAFMQICDLSREKRCCAETRGPAIREHEDSDYRYLEATKALIRKQIQACARKLYSIPINIYERIFAPPGGIMSLSEHCEDARRAQAGT